MTVAVFLDRDNTLIRNDGDLGDPARVRLMPGAVDAVRLLTNAGYVLIVITNQGGVARGVYDESAVHAVHAKIDALLIEHGCPPINAYYHCPYHPQGVVAQYRREHPWRKPAPGMLLAAAEAYDLDLARCWLIGDQARDIEAGRAAGCRTIRLGDAADDTAQADHRCGTILDAARYICEADAR
ncbi:MAG: HAD family hydrolase [Phycisphaerales bacterium]|nr:HAD family hydrolase [Phycisphaerales bacterium]